MTDETTKEVAKAAQALAPVIREPVQLITGALRWVGGQLGRPFSIAVGMVEDALYAARVRGRVRVIEKTLKMLAGREIPPESIPAGFLVPFLEASGDAQEDDIQELWAALLASAATSRQAQNSAFVQVLRSMSREDARRLKSILTECDSAGAISLGNTYGDQIVGLSVELSHLKALGLVSLHSHAVDTMGMPRAAGRAMPATAWVLAITSFGKAFASALRLVSADSQSDAASGIVFTLECDGVPLKAIQKSGIYARPLAPHAGWQIATLRVVHFSGTSDAQYVTVGSAQVGVAPGSEKVQPTEDRYWGPFASADSAAAFCAQRRL